MPTAYGNHDPKSPHRTGGGRIRAAIGFGRPQDKVPTFDPATAPVRTDAEAAGYASPRAESEDATRTQARTMPPQSAPADHGKPGRSQLQSPERRMAWLMALGLAFLILLGLAAAVVTLP